MHLHIDRNLHNKVVVEVRKLALSAAYNIKLFRPSNVLHNLMYDDIPISHIMTF